MKTNNTPSIYVACLAAYNNGILHGQWIDATQDADDIHAEIAAMLAASPISEAEEYAIHDTDNFEGIDIGEYASIELVAEVAAALEEHGQPFAAYAKHNSLREALDNFEDAYQGSYDSEESFAEQLLEDTGCLSEVPQHLRNYIDFKSYAQDLELGGDYTFIRANWSETYVFNNHH